jgi:hypothetical protein
MVVLMENIMIYTKVPKSKQRKVPKVVQAQYDQWLCSHKPKSFIMPKIIKKPLTRHLPQVPIGRETPNYPSKVDTHSGALTKSGIMKEYHLMTADERKKIDDLGMCVAPLHKGNYIYITPGMNPAGFGRKNEVL